MPQGLPRRLRTVFILQAVLASLVVIAGFYLAGHMVKELLGAERLRTEAEDYWAGRARDPAYPLPRSSAMRSYFVPAGSDPEAAALPQVFRGLATGIHKLSLPGDRTSRVIVDERAPGRLYLQMSFLLVERVLLWTGVVSTLLALLTIWMTSWLSYRSAKRLVAPVNWLAAEVSQWDPRQPDLHAIDPARIPGDAREVHQLGSALRDLAARTQQFVQRERDFTRDASHELRTPLTVVRVATDMMRSDPEMPLRLQRSLRRVQQAGQDMEAVIDAFLILAREAEVAPQVEEFDVREIVYEAVGKARPLLEGKPVVLEVVENASPRLHAFARALGVMLDNLLGNACAFTERGRIEVRIEADRIVVEDTGVGMNAETLQRAYDPFYRADQFTAVGKGMGLSIVRRLGERFGWPVTLESVPDVGTTATIRFRPVTFA